MDNDNKKFWFSIEETDCILCHKKTEHLITKVTRGKFMIIFAVECLICRTK